MSGDENDQKRPSVEVALGDSEQAKDVGSDNIVVKEPTVAAVSETPIQAAPPRSAPAEAPRPGAPTFSLNRPAAPKVVKKPEAVEEEDEDDLGDDDNHDDLSEENLDFVSDDPLAPAYDLERGAPLDKHAMPDRLPWRSEVRSAKEFFTTEVLYRFDIIEPADRVFMVGRYRIELRGANGGVWTLVVGEEMEVLPHKEDADIVLIMQHRDFMQIVNGVLNPQLAILAQKVRVQGDVKRAILLQSVLAPASE